MEVFSRNIKLIGEPAQQKILSARVCVVGLGGVGGYIVEFLARAGIQSFTLIDFDTVEESNINRQIYALSDSIGRYKAELSEERVKKINPKAQVRSINKRFTSQNLDYIMGADFVVDAIDSVEDKADLIALSKQNGIEIVSAMGAGNRFDIPSFEVLDIYSTSSDGLARAMRRNLRKRGVISCDCVQAKSPSLKIDGCVGSVSYYPAAQAAVIAAFVINKIISKA